MGSTMTTDLTDAPVVLEIAGVTKRFGALVANDAIDLDVRRGEILALLGENGAGKTTLMNILFGHYVADEGAVRVADEQGELHALPPGSPRAALDAGVGMVHQHFTLAESLTVLENIVLGVRPLFSLSLDLGAARSKLSAIMAESGLTVELEVPVSRLSVGEKQRVEILKVLYRGARILVLDEPTAVLRPQEAEGLMTVLRRLAAAGFALIFISHKLGEVLALADRVAILRGGRKVAERPVAGADRAMLASLMVGREVVTSLRDVCERGEPVLVIDEASVTLSASSRVGLNGASLTVHAGEIVGIAGVSGNGQAALAGLVAGTVRPDGGRVTLFGRPLPSTPRGSIDAGVARIPEDRHREGAVGPLSVAENLVLEDLADPGIQRFGFLRFDQLKSRAKEAIARFDVRGATPDTPIRLLSGGNMQKVILARLFAREPRMVLADQPTRGLDVGASAEVHRKLLEARGRGAAILLVSEDLDELLALCDRIAVIAQGRLSRAEPVETLSVARLGLLMAGQDDGGIRESAA
jgi:ABC-type uncharacterized transport system ATPase subunit